MRGGVRGEGFIILCSEMLKQLKQDTYEMNNTYIPIYRKRSIFSTRGVGVQNRFCRGVGGVHMGK